MKTWKPNRNGGGTMSESPVCHRFIVLSIPGTRHVMLCFTENAHQTQTVLKWSPRICPGSRVIVVSPRVQSFMEDNPVIVLKEPLIPTADGIDEIFQVPPPVNMTKAQFSGFDFVTKSFFLMSAAPVDGVCSGVYCDSQSETKPCSCNAANNQKKWSLQVMFDCDEFQAVSKNDVTITSMRTTKVFVHPTVLTLPLCDLNTNTLEMEDSVSRFLI